MRTKRPETPGSPRRAEPVVVLRRASERAAERRGTPSDLLVVGLGNPGEKYARTRHNVGADTVALLAERHGGRLRAGREYALVDEVRIGPHRVALVFPQTFYNESGRAVGALVRRHGITDLDRLVIVHDEMDLPVGDLKVKSGGGLAGNNGLRSIRQYVGSAEFTRVRIGIDKPRGRQDGADHVLRRPTGTERRELDVTIEQAADAVEAILTDGLAAAMAHHNRRS